MRVKKMVPGVAAVLLGMLSLLARGADPAESPDWWQAEREVAADLGKPSADVAALAAAARAAKPTTGREAMYNLCVLLRAGMNRDAQTAVQELRRTAPELDSGQIAGIYYVACDSLGAWDVAQTLLEEFAANVQGINPGNQLLKQMMASGQTVDQIDGWLAHMPPGRENFWVKERLRFNVEQGRGDDLVQQLSDQVRAHPDDAGRAITLLDALLYARPRKAGKLAPDLAWMAETVKLKLATDAADLGQRLKQFQQPVPAVAFYRQAIETPLTDQEIQRLVQMVPHRLGQMRAETVLAMFDAHVREEIAECLLTLGQNAEAQQWMVEAAEIRKKHGLGLNALFAGRAQAASGQRVIEGRIREEEKLSENDPAYWRERAQYYHGRKDAAQEEDALKKALALAKPLPAPAAGMVRQGDLRVGLVYSYARFLARHKRSDDAVAFLRNEIGEAPADAASVGVAVRYLASHLPQQVRAEDEVLWQWLAKRPKWESTEDSLLWRMLENAQDVERDKHFSHAEQLVVDDDPSRAFTLGRIMNRMHQAQRSVPLLEQAVRSASDPDLRRRAAMALFESYLDLGDWKRAESLFPEAAVGLTVHEQPQWYSRIALVAAKAGAKDDALRIWKAGADMSPAEMRGLDELANAGLRKELAEYYRQMQLRMPTSEVPPQALKTLEATR